MICKLIHLFLWISYFRGSYGHGRLVDPPARGTMWRLGFTTPPNYNDHELFCGGFARQWMENKGRCGECGDPYDLPRPRPNESGGTFGTGIISRAYRREEVITITVHLTANHLGWFEFRLCENNIPKQFVKQSCLNKNVLQLADHSGTRYELKHAGHGLFRVRVKLPKNVTCTNCVIQWHYTSGNNWGFCSQGADKVGCGPQEVFRGCSDVAIFEEEDDSYFKFQNLTRIIDYSQTIKVNEKSGMYELDEEGNKNNENDIEWNDKKDNKDNSKSSQKENNSSEKEEKEEKFVEKTKFSNGRSYSQINRKKARNEETEKDSYERLFNDKDRDRDRDKDRDKDRDMEKDRNRDSDNDTDRGKDSDREKDRDRDKDSYRERDRGRGKDTDFRRPVEGDSVQRLTNGNYVYSNTFRKSLSSEEQTKIRDYLKNLPSKDLKSKDLQHLINRPRSATSLERTENPEFFAKFDSLSSGKNTITKLSEVLSLLLSLTASTSSPSEANQILDKLAQSLTRAVEHKQLSVDRKGKSFPRPRIRSFYADVDSLEDLDDESYLLDTSRLYSPMTSKKRNAIAALPRQSIVVNNPSSAATRVNTPDSSRRSYLARDSVRRSWNPAERKKMTRTRPKFHARIDRSSEEISRSSLEENLREIVRTAANVKNVKKAITLKVPTSSLPDVDPLLKFVLSNSSRGIPSTISITSSEEVKVPQQLLYVLLRD